MQSTCFVDDESYCNESGYLMQSWNCHQFLASYMNIVFVGTIFWVMFSNAVCSMC